MISFAEALNNESRKTYTENGATAYNSTNDALLDLFGSIGSLRQTDNDRKIRLFTEAFNQDKLLATKILFYARDIREGLGERDTFRTLLNYCATNHPDVIRPNIALIPYFGRFDDLYSLVDTPLEDEMWAYVKETLNNDIQNCDKGQPCSLLAKWLKTPDASSKNTRKLGIITANKLGMSVYSYKKILRKLRAYIKVTEVRMSAQKWSDIEYSSVPSRAMHLYGKAFLNHDEKRFRSYLDNVAQGVEKINASTLYPYDIIGKYFSTCGWTYVLPKREDPVLEAQWKALPNYVDGTYNAIVIADTSGSMSGRPLNSALGLVVYFAERNNGPFHNLWMSFSDKSTVHKLKGESLYQKLGSIDIDDWGSSTNLERAFMHILDIAKENNVPNDEMVKSIVVISDMEINQCTTGQWSFYDEMRTRYAECGYDIPNVVFWNVNSRHDVFHADRNRKGVQLCSGQSASTFKILMNSIGKTPIDMMMDVLNSERYSQIKVA